MYVIRVGCLLLVFSTKACGKIVSLRVHHLAMVPNSEIQWYLLAMTRDAPCGQVILPGLFWESESPQMLLCMCVIWCVLMDFGRHLRVQKPAKYTVVCWTGFWVSFESMEKKRRKKELYFLLWCVTDFFGRCSCLCLQAWLLCLRDSEGFWECESLQM